MWYIYNIMNFPGLHKLTDAGLLGVGKVLIAQPFMTDSTFSRSVVLLCEHGANGSIGYVLNRPTSIEISELVAGEYPELSVYHGGPVQLDTLHMLHRMYPELGGAKLRENLYWGGNFDALKFRKVTESLKANLRLYVGYAGWGTGQLERELEEGSWYIADTEPDLIFNSAPEDMWKQAILALGDEYRYLANMPLDPGLN